MSEEYNLGPGLGNVVCGLMRKLRYAGHQLEERERTIINVSTYEVTAALWALQEYVRRHDLKEGE